MQRRHFIKTTVFGTTVVTVSPLLSFSPNQDKAGLPEGDFCLEGNRNIPLIKEVDVLVVGGSSGAVAAAAKAAQEGAGVMLVTHLPYLGEDICGMFQYWIHPDESLTTGLAQKVFNPSLQENAIPTPLHVKATLDNALIEQKVDFLYSVFPAGVLVTGQNEPAGIIIANRSGRQAIIAKTVIDATRNAVVARLYGAESRHSSKSIQPVKYITVGSKPELLQEKLDYRRMPVPVSHGNKSFDAYEFSFRMEMNDSSYASCCEVEQMIRDKTWDPWQVDAADMLQYVPADPIVGQESRSRALNLQEPVPWKAFQPKDSNRIYLLNPCADIPREEAEKLLRPAMLMELGEQFGEKAVRELQSFPNENIQAGGDSYKKGFSKGKVMELLSHGMRNSNPPAIMSKNMALPVIGRYDVVVVGGGSGGAPAAIGAAREGAATLLVEYMQSAGGTGTNGMIHTYWFGYKEGFTQTLDEGVKRLGYEYHPRVKAERPWPERGWNAAWKAEWYRKEIRKAGGEIWFGCLGCGAYVIEGEVKGVVVATPFGRGLVLANNVIDSTGSADIAIAAGAGYEYTKASHVAVQGAGLPARSIEWGKSNTDWTFIDDSDIQDIWRTFVVAKKKYPGAYDLGKLLQTRERRKVTGDYQISVLDVYNKAHYGDTISMHRSNFDTHGMTVSPFLVLRPPAKDAITAEVPFRSLLPKGLEGIMVTGLGISAHRDALPVLRMQACVQNQGFAAGMISAYAAGTNQHLRKIDFKKMQKRLVDMGNLPSSVLEKTSAKIFSDSEIENAVNAIDQELQGLEVILYRKEKAFPLLKEKFNNTGSQEQKEVYARIIAMHGINFGAGVLIDSIQSYMEWDKGWNYTGMHQFGECMSYLDTLIIALGRTRQEKGIACIAEKAEKLTSDSAFSHFRAVAMALETIGSKEGVDVLHRLLLLHGVQGHPVITIEEALAVTDKDLINTKVRNRSLREIVLARALFRCGDKNNAGQAILEKYARDLRGHYHLHTASILKR